MEDCIFCKIVKGEIPCHKIFENDKVLSFADINPISKGHVLIIPKSHAETIWEIDVEDLRERADHQRFGQAGHAHQQAVPATEHGDQELLDHLVEETEHVMEHQHLTVARRSGSDSDRRDAQPAGNVLAQAFFAPTHRDRVAEEDDAIALLELQTLRRRGTLK